MKPQTLTLCTVLALCSGPPLTFAQTAPSVAEPKAFAEIAASSNMFEIEFESARARAGE